MFILILVTFLTTSAIQGTKSYEECKAVRFKPTACENAKAMNDTTDFLTSLQK